MQMAWRRMFRWYPPVTASDDWGNAVVVDPRQLERLRATSARQRAWKLAVYLLAGSCATLAVVACWQGQRLEQLTQDFRGNRRSLARSGAALAALAHSHETILAATQQAPSVGTKSWGRRFTVTKYLARSSRYGKFNDGLTATLTKADPAARIVAVDPKLIPYGSWLWVEDLGWFQAEDCGSDIKGFRLDILSPTEADARTFGRQDRFAIVVPPTGA